jgi:hypothetical protein
VVEHAGTPLDRAHRRQLAWAGVEAGFADRLRAEASALSAGATPELAHVAWSTVARLEQQRSIAVGWSLPPR